MPNASSSADSLAVATFDGEEIPILDLHPPRRDLREEVVEGLSRPGQRALPCKLFYDEAGSRLFDRITHQPEYYPTRCETAILRACRGELAERLGDDLTLVEYGSGSSVKTRLLLDALSVQTYVPIDISRWYLTTAAERLQKRYPDLAIRPVCADYTQRLRLPEGTRARRVGFFPGGTIGNFTPQEAIEFLETAAEALGRGQYLVLGVDQKKDPLRLHAAYNDAAGVTADFNLNLLRRLESDLGAQVDHSAWRHYAPYNVAAGRIEMHLVAIRPTTLAIAGQRFDFTRGQSIHTESSFKYTPGEFAELASSAGFAVERVWTDDEDLFTVQLLRVRD